MWRQRRHGGDGDVETEKTRGDGDVETEVGMKQPQAWGTRRHGS